jgi:hypothetical protein
MRQYWCWIKMAPAELELPEARPTESSENCGHQKSSAPSAPTREQRGLQLYRDHAEEIVFEHGVWLVPSQHDVTSVYEVTLGRRGESCECRDWEFRGGQCAHVYAATVARSKTATCSSCNERFPRLGTVEVGPEQAEASLGEALEGERYCRPCARRRGVL